jgi:hypothetical protein
MVDILLLQTVSILIASASVVGGMIYSALQLRHLRKQRQTDLVVRLYSAFTSDDYLVARAKVRNLEFKDYRDFVKKYGSLSLETPVNLAVLKIANFYDGVGNLLHRGLVDADMVCESMGPPAIITWNKLKPIIEGYREEVGFKYSAWFEYLCNEVKKREPKWQSLVGLKGKSVP